LGWGRLTGKIRRGQPLPQVSRLHKTAEQGPPVADDLLYRVVDTLESLAAETGKSVPQLAINWLLRKPTISTVIIGARNETQLRDNLAAASFTLTAEQVARLDEVSQSPVPYPYWHQRQYQNRNPLPPSYRA
jgi:aryl-alcohol dehydrogenase-like predicted oxidoreductase